MPDLYSAEIPGLYQVHLQHLLSSGISIEVIKERGYKTVTTAKELKRLEFSQFPRFTTGILIPLHAPDGADAGYVYRPDTPRLDKEKDKPIKYEGVPHSRARADMPLRCVPAARNPNIELWITEGAKKADALASHGACALNLPGVWGFKGKNEWGATVLLADFDFIAWKGRTVYLAYDSDAQSNPQVNRALLRAKEHFGRKGAKVYFVNLPVLEAGKKTGIDDYLAAGHSLDEARTLAAEQPPELEEEPLALHSEVYCVHEDQFCLIKTIFPIGKVKSPLCNFTAHITDEVTLDDGIQESRLFSIEGSVKGVPLPRIEVPASDFHNLSWVTELWGTRAVVYAGSSTKDHLRTIIQLASNTNGFKSKRVFTHTGWRVIEGERFFLTAAGAVGKEGVEVSLHGPLGRYRLPLTLSGADPVEAMKASLRFLDVGNPEVQACLWASMYLAPLSEVLEPAFSLWLSGHTGSFKSVLAALALSHFGDFNYLTLPASWRDTANRLEWAMAMLKDLPLVIDDWHPAPTATGARELEMKAELVIRGQGNKAGRGRLRADASPREKYVPRSMVISTGEQIPGGESGASRLFVVELERDQVNLAELSRAQGEAKAGLYSYAMSAYILWLKERWEELEPYIKARWLEWRDQAMGGDVHLRLPAAVAWLYSGFMLGMRFAEEIGSIEATAAAERCEQAWESFISLAARQGWRVDEERPAVRFLDAFSTLLMQKRILVISKESLEPMPGEMKQGQVFVGWADEKAYYLMPTAVYGTVYDFWQHAGAPFTFKPATVWADLARLRMLSAGDSQRTQVAVWIGSTEGSTKRVIALKKASVVEKSEEPIENE